MKRWIMDRLPTREQLLANRWLQPMAHRLTHPLLWHFNRRSIARGVALGLLAGFLIPLGQTPAAAMLALTARANLIIAAFATLVTNPLTFPPIYFAAFKLGHRLLGEGRVADSGDWLGQSAQWIYNIVAPTALGLLLFGTVAAALGYQLVNLLWRWHVARRWRQRSLARQDDGPCLITGNP
ncbi:DUF2062 domain-containing protein [Sphingobium lignivorans]|uniref:DUF2062 domain-containing protein n=1 Tax=Sphingobium lignivorans TaxID=2735886 RepID=A0ABR6NKN3_9SPHN|nr:DUF2062 domain-containing protein [Sphingobium lignivorans]MBB5987681.1 hypothetical protein [Sphingobium lignivorans]